MTDVFVSDARRWSAGLIERERRKGSKVPAALRDIADRLGIDHGDLWALRYRPPRDIMTSVYMRLKAAYEAECERQEARLAHELMLTKAAGYDATTSSAVAQAEAFLASKDGAPK